MGTGSWEEDLVGKSLARLQESGTGGSQELGKGLGCGGGGRRPNPSNPPWESKTGESQQLGKGLGCSDGGRRRPTSDASSESNKETGEAGLF